MAKVARKTITHLSEEELRVLRGTAYAVWEELAYDVLTMTAEDKGKDINSVTIPRAEVLELVLDADRLFSRLPKAKYPALAAIANYDYADAIEADLKKTVFTFARYGL